jgi:hypothetical protein
LGILILLNTGSKISDGQIAAITCGTFAVAVLAARCFHKME